MKGMLFYTWGILLFYFLPLSLFSQTRQITNSPVKEVDLYNTIGTDASVKVYTWPYTRTYSNIKKLDTLIVSYVMPAVPSNTSVKLEYEILNENQLNDIRTVYVNVQ